MVSRTYNTFQTLGSGIRTIPITVTTTPTSLDDLLDAAESGRSSLPGRRVLILHNKSLVTVYILESSSQTVGDGWEIATDQKFNVEGSESFTWNDFIDDPVEVRRTGFYLAVEAGTATVKVLEGI